MILFLIKFEKNNLKILSYNILEEQIKNKIEMFF